MNPDEARKLALSLSTDLPELDLHGLYPQEAEARLELFLFDAHRMRHAGARIIYGVGSGVLRRHIVSHLQNHPLVDYLLEEEGSCKIILKYYFYQ